MAEKVSIIIPAWNEEERIGATLRTLRQEQAGHAWWHELIVIDDGSTDHTAHVASQWADRVISLPYNMGKGTALHVGCQQASHPIVLLLDADLGTSVVHAQYLLPPIVSNGAHMTVAQFPQATHKGGLGLVKGLAAFGIHRLSGYRAQAPLSGQRALRKALLVTVHPFAKQFGIEVGLTIDVARRGYTIQEIALPFAHRETGREFKDWVHRGKQFTAVGWTLLDRWMRPIC